LIVLIILMPLASSLGFKFYLRLDVDFVRETLRFSAANYLSTIFSTAIYLILPIMVMSVLGAIETAHFSLALKISSLLFIVPATIGEALFIEGSSDKDLKRLVLQTIKVIMISSIVLSIILYIFSYQMLQFIGRDAFNETYLESLTLLRILIFSSFFVAFISIYLAIKKIEKDINSLVLVSGLITFTVMISCYVFMRYLGFLGLGYGWIVGYGLSSIVIGIMAFREYQSGIRIFLIRLAAKPKSCHAKS
jgi:O-antigen/teichoic acid export membrane protein